MNRLTERSENGQVYTSYCYNAICDGICILCDYEDKILEKLAEYEDAEEQGKLIILPCRVGDTVYTACSWGIESGVVGSIEIFDDRIFVNNVHGAMMAEAHNVFLTKEEALAKMKEV